jgi:mannose-6-phosphate isomerase-like protein (cupin superfamily)
MAHGSMQVRFYAPRGVDEQTPHGQDELYVVVQGSGSLRSRHRGGPSSCEVG